jgi:WD40 repeat protein
MTETIAAPAAPKQGALPDGPYVGLVPFQEADSDFFFGRERDTLVITANLETARLTLLYGASGVGKSSVLEAGAVHHLRQGSRDQPTPAGHPAFAMVVFRSWRDDPVAGLAAAVRDAVRDETGIELPASASLVETLAACARTYDGEMLVVLDQFEEFFVYQHGEAADSPFVAELAEAIKRSDLRVHFLMAMREDALARLDLFKGRIHGLFENRLRVEHLTLDAGREAIERPIEEWNDRVGEANRVTIERGLVDKVLAQVRTGRVQAGRAGVGEVKGAGGEARIEAAYLQLVMTRLWEEERAAGSRTLTLATLERLGGAASIVRAHLDRAVESLSESEQDIAARIFDHLVTPSGTKIAHATPDLAKYAKVDEAQLASVLDKLAAARILRPVSAPDGGATRFEIFHDVLAASILEWRARYVQEQERVAAEREHRRERRRRVIRGLAALVLLALVVIAGLAIVAINQRRDAQRQRDRAVSAQLAASQQRQLAHARELLAQASAQRFVDPALGLLLAIRAHQGLPANLRPRLDAELPTVVRPLLLAPYTREVLHAGGEVVAVDAAEVGADGRVVTATADGKVRIWDPATGRRVGAEIVQRPPIRRVALSPSGAYVLTAGGGSARIWDASTGAPVSEPLETVVGGAVRTAAFDPADESRIVVVAGEQAQLYEWRPAPATIRPVGQPMRHGGTVCDAVFSPGGTLVATTSVDPAAHVGVFDSNSGLPRNRLTWPTSLQECRFYATFDANGARVATLGGGGVIRIWRSTAAAPAGPVELPRAHTSAIVSIAFSPSPDTIGRSLLVSASEDGTARLWNTDSGVSVSLLHGHTDFLTAAVFGDHGTYVATASDDNTARVWGAETGRLRAVLAGHTGAVTSVAFGPGNQYVITGSADGTARIWQPQLLSPLWARVEQDEPVRTIDDSVSRHLVAAGIGDDVRFFDPSDFAEAGPALTHPAPVTEVRFRPDGGVLATVAGLRARLWDVATRRLEHVFGTDVTSVDLGPTQVVTGAADGVVALWNLHTGKLVRQLASGDPVAAVALSPDGTRVAIARDSSSPAVQIVSAVDGEQLATLKGHSRPIASVRFSPNGSRVLTASADRTARVWDARSGRELLELHGHFGGVNGATYTNNGGCIVTAGPASAGLWDASTGALLTLLEGNRRLTTGTRRIWQVATTPDETIVTAGDDGTIRTYQASVCASGLALVQIARARVAAAERTLGPGELRLFGIEQS